MPILFGDTLFSQGQSSKNKVMSHFWLCKMDRIIVTTSGIYNRSNKTDVQYSCQPNNDDVRNDRDDFLYVCDIWMCRTPSFGLTMIFQYFFFLSFCNTLLHYYLTEWLYCLIEDMAVMTWKLPVSRYKLMLLKTKINFRFLFTYFRKSFYAEYS